MLKVVEVMLIRTTKYMYTYILGVNSAEVSDCCRSEYRLNCIKCILRCSFVFFLRNKLEEGYSNFCVPPHTHAATFCLLRILQNARKKNYSKTFTTTVGSHIVPLSFSRCHHTAHHGNADIRYQCITASGLLHQSH